MKRHACQNNERSAVSQTFRGGLRNTFLASAALLAGFALAAPLASAQDKKGVKIGVLGAVSGPYGDVGGHGSVVAAQMAIADFGGSVLGKPIELVSADHQSKPDTAVTIARTWIDVDGVDVITDLSTSPVAIAVQKLAADKKRITLNSTASTDALTNHDCTPYGAHWTYDSYSIGKVVASGIAKPGSTWFFLTVDNAGGAGLQNALTPFLLAKGAKIVGSVRHPINTTDMSSFLLQAQGSRAKMIGIASAGDDMERAVRQGGEFGLWRQQQAVAFGMQLYNVPSVGVAAMRGILHNSIFYWDRTEATRAFSKRLWAILGKPPAETHAVNYSAAGAYLRAVQAAGTKETEPVLAALRAMKVDDVVTPGGQVRADGRLVRPTFLLEVKAPDQVKETWDVFTVKGEIPGDVAFRSPADSACPLLRG